MNDQQMATQVDDADFSVQKSIEMPREISWLSFNHRVLQEAEDKSNPLIERMRFLGIFSSNMDEFFRVRVADVRRQMLLTNYTDSIDQSEHLLSEIHSKINQLGKRFDQIYKVLRKDLLKKNIEVLPNTDSMSESQIIWLKNYYRTNIRPFLSPIIAHEEMDLQLSLNDNDFYLAVSMNTGTKTTQAVVEVPTSDTGRFVVLPKEKNQGRLRQILLLEDAIKFSLDDIFKTAFEYESITAHSFKMTRDAELNLSDEIDESLLDKMSSGIHKRLTAEPVRLVYDKEMPEDMVKFLKRRLHFTSFDSFIPSGATRNFRDFIGMPNVGLASLEFTSLASVPSSSFDSYDSAFEAISAKDILLYYPYHSFDYFTEWLRQASFDPKVTAIYINLYRVAKNSKVIGALADATRNGKKVSVVVELHARFDEKNNVDLARQLQTLGARVEFGIPSLKVHSKLCVIERKEKGRIKRYAHTGTGNFHEKNARIYTDYSLFTDHPKITREVMEVFEFIKYSYRQPKLKHLILSPVNSRQRINQLIDHEIALAEAGRKAGFKIKVNNLVDAQINEKLCAAAEAGVEIKLIVRGMCTLKTHTPQQQKNIQITSIIDRFLEHARVMIFGNDGDPKVFITSADLMTRNIDFRVEVGIPIYDVDLKQQIIDVFDIQLKDNVKARVVDNEQKNAYVKRRSGRNIRSQISIHNYLMKVNSLPQ